MSYNSERKKECWETSCFPIRLKELRERRRISRRVLADFCEISRSTVARYESGEREPTAKTICRMADYFGVSVDYLLGREKIF